MNHAQQKPKKRFVLTMRNQKGQVGIFVALIFQVIFVFFAMLVNVGLVVHHKINLQQSTDLAAYYGAMKQAEVMNVMAHVNYQIRQAWKLFAWRYRVLGTFGLEQQAKNPPLVMQFPVQWNTNDAIGPLPRYNLASKAFTCPASVGSNAEGVTITDVPFMCMGHNGFADWISSPQGDLKETYCKIDCGSIQNRKTFSITEVPPVGTSPIFGNGMGGSVQTAIDYANSTLKNTCQSLGPVSTQMLAFYYGSYIKDTQNRRNFIYMLAKNLGLPEDKMLDIEGNSILTGVRNTLKYNLTEANASSLPDSSIVAFNGVKSFSGGTSFAEAMIREITFKRLMFFLVDCVYTPSPSGGYSGDAGSKVELKSLYSGSGNELDQNISDNLPVLLKTDTVAIEGIKDAFRLNDTRSNTIGYEKNPWIQVYYGVKATSEPKIPFLPLAKIKLHAVSFAKPFGGSIGPWYFKNWEAGTDDNSGRSDWGNRTDINLPRRNTDGLPPTPTLKQARDFLLNYSTYVGDTYANDATTTAVDNKGGLANTDIVAFYHTLLANKYGVGSADFSSDKMGESMQGHFKKPTQWPKYAEWFHLGEDVSSPMYDPLALDRSAGYNNPKNTYMRDIELSVVAPNQFDVTYYSIEPDFHSVYGEKLFPQVIQNIATATGTSPPPVLPLDFGHRRNVNIPGIPNKFNVRSQLEVTHKLFKEAVGSITSTYAGGNGAMRFALDVIASRQSSLLTSWTFLNLTANGYSEFPSPTKTGGKYSMLFGTCDPTMNPWTEEFKAPHIDDSNLPAVPGNCVTGGRTGYSVKLISSDILRFGRIFENLGGPGMNGQIRNPVPEDFLQF